MSDKVFSIRLPFYYGERGIRTPEPFGTDLQSVAVDQLCYLSGSYRSQQNGNRIMY